MYMRCERPLISGVSGKKGATQVQRVTDPVFGRLSRKSTWWSGEAQWPHEPGVVGVMIFSDSEAPTERDRRAFLGVRSVYAKLLPEISRAVFSLWEAASAGADPATSEQLFKRLHLECLSIDPSGSVDLMYEGDVGLFTVRIDAGNVRPRTFDGGTFRRVDL
jgi:hypothetical protein